MLTYKKCVLEQPLGKFRQRKTDWVPEGLAVVGSVVSQRLQQDVWGEGWFVMEVLNETTTADAIEWQSEWKKLK